MESPDLEAQLQRWRRRCLQERCFFLSVLALGGLLFYFTVLKHRVCAILVEGREVVYVPDEATARSLLLELLREKSPRPDDDSAGFVQEVTWRKVIRRGQRLSTPEEASRLLETKLEVNLPAVAVWVDGRRLLAMLSEAAATQVLETLKARYAGKQGSLVDEARFKENIQIHQEYVPVGEICPSVEEGVRRLSGGTAQATTYRVQPGDLAIHIAKRHHLSLAQLQALNPGRKLDRLTVGEELQVSRLKPLLTVVTVEEKSFEAPVPAPLRTVPDTTLAPGQRLVRHPGKPGKSRVWVRLTLENGQEVRREKVAEEILRPPIPREVRVGPTP